MRTIIYGIAACALVALVAAFLARGPIERQIFLGNARRALGGDVDVGSAVYANGSWEVRRLTVAAADDSMHLEALGATIANGAPMRVVLDAPELTVASARAGLPELDGFERAFPHASIVVRDGGARIGPLGFVAIDGRFDLGVPATLTGDPSLFDGTVEVKAGDATYPVAARVAMSHGLREQIVSAAAIPAATLAGFADDSPAHPVSGMLRDVNVTFARSLRGIARLDDVTFALGAHALRGLHGELTFGDGGVGSKKIVGRLDAVPFDATGEVHDLREPVAWLADGSRDLGAFAKLLTEIAGESKLSSVHFDTSAPGIGFALYTMQGEHGPLAVNVLTIEPAEPTLRFDTAIAEDHVISRGERTSAMGVRTGAVAGVNGDYFDIGRTYQPQGMLERGGRIVRGPVERAALVIDKGNHVRFDVFHVAGTVRAGGHVYPVTQINDWPAGEATVITPAFGKILPAAPGVTFARIVPTDRANRYRVVGVNASNEPQPVSLGIAFGTDTRAVVRVGELVDMTYAIEPSIAGSVAAIGGGPILVRNGSWYEDPHAPAPDERDYRWPVVALARQADDHLLLVAVDGRHPDRSVGMTRPEFADLLIRFGAIDAMALDSGGSVTMVSRAPGDANVSVRNVPSDNSAERWVSDALFLYSTAPVPTIVAPAVAATPVAEARPTP